MTTTRVCSECGKLHSSADMELGYRKPDAVHALSEAQQKTRCRQSADAAVLDESRFFLRGVLPLPVHGRVNPYHIGAWVELSKAAFIRATELWSDPDQADEPQFPGTLANSLPLNADSLGLSLFVQLTGPTTRPTLHVALPGHALYQEQQTGISEHRAHEYTECRGHQAGAGNAAS